MEHYAAGKRIRVDLHIHSYLSDGKYSPSEIVEYSAQNKLDIISLTDHDTIAGLQEMRHAVKTYETIRFISGVEVSTCLKDDELHILGYGIDETHPGIVQLLDKAQAGRQNRVDRILKCLRDFDIRLTLEAVKNGGNTMSLGRMHIAHLLVKRGHVRTVREAFDRYLSYEMKIIEHPSTDFVSSHRAIEYILEAGGIPVFAHPTIRLFDRHIDTLKEAGLQGVEVFKGSRPSIEEFYLETVVKDKGLLLTGGSDWHGHKSTLSLGSFYVDSARIQPFLKTVQFFE